MATTIEEIVVLVRGEITDLERKLKSSDQAITRFSRGAAEAGRAWDRGMREVAAASERAARETSRAGERAAREAVRQAGIVAREHTRLANQWAREQETAARRVEAAARRAGAIQAQVAADLSRSMTLAGAGMAGALALAAKQAISFEASMIRVAKTTGLSGEEFATLEKTLRRMATVEIPLQFEELARIAEVGGQLGIAAKDIESFTRTTAQMAAATDLSADGAAEAMARISNVMGLTARDFQALGSTIVDLGNKSAAGEREIVEFSQRLTGAGRVAGVATADIVAFSAAMASVGINAEAGGTAFSKVIKDIANAAASGGKELNQFAQIAGLSSRQFQRLFREDSGRAIATFVEGLATLRKQGVNLFPVLEGLGIRDERMADALLRLAGNQGTVTKALSDARPAWQRQNALSQEAGAQFRSTAAQVKFFQNQIRDVGNEIGIGLLPYLRDGLRLFSDWVRAFNELSPAAQGFVTTLGAVGAATLLLGGRVLALVGGIVQLRAALAGLATANAAAAVSGAGAAATGTGLLARAAPVAGAIGRAVPWVGAALGGAALGTYLADRQSRAQGLVSRAEADRIRQREADRRSLAGAGIFPGGLVNPGATLALPEGLRRIQEARAAAPVPTSFPGARPSVPHFETKESRAAGKRADAARQRAAREAEALERQRAQNLAAARQDLLLEQMRTRGEMRGAFIIENRRLGVPDALSGKIFDARQFREAKALRDRRAGEEQRRATTDRDEMERRQRESLAETLVGLDTRRQVAGLRAAGDERGADFAEMLSGNRELNTLLAAQPSLMTHVQGVFNQTWDAENTGKIETAVDLFADLRRELLQVEADARLAAAGLADSFEGKFSRFARERPEILSAFALGNLGAVGEAFSLFGRAEAAENDAERAERLRQARVDRDRQRAEASASLDQRRRSLLSGEFGAFSVSRETLDDTGRARQPFDLSELRSQFQMAKQLETLESLAGGVRDTFLTAFSDIMTGAKGFFGSLVAGFTATFQRIAAEFLASQAMNLLLGLAGSLFGGGPSLSPVASLSGRGFGIPGRAMGGPVWGGRPYLVGENGPELFIPRASGAIAPNASVAAAGPSVTIHVHGVTDAASFRKSRGQIEGEIGRSLDRRRARDM